MIFNLNFLLNYSDWGLFILRLAVAIIFIYHGWPKVKNYKSIDKMWILSSKMVLVLGLIEVLAGIGLVLGILVQLIAVVLIIDMLAAMTAKMRVWHVPFMSHDTTGWEFDFILLAASIVILVTGGGIISLTYLLH